MNKNRGVIEKGRTTITPLRNLYLLYKKQNGSIPRFSKETCLSIKRINS